MDHNLVSVIWDEIKRYINTVDRSEAAENLVGILIDNDVDAEDIRQAFVGDKDIKAALSHYLSTDNDDLDEDQDIDESDDWDH